MRLTWLNFCRTRMTDLSVLSRLPLLHLDLRRTRTTELFPLMGVELTGLDIRFTAISDLSPLERMPLEELSFHPVRIRKGLESLRGTVTLKRINGKPAEEFWRLHGLRRFGNSGRLVNLPPSRERRQGSSAPQDRPTRGLPSSSRSSA